MHNAGEQAEQQKQRIGEEARLRVGREAVVEAQAAACALTHPCEIVGVVVYICAEPEKMTSSDSEIARKIGDAGQQKGERADENGGAGV